MMEDMVDELVIDTTEDSDDEDQDEDLMDDDDRQLIDGLLQRSSIDADTQQPRTSTADIMPNPTADIRSSSRRDLISAFEGVYDSQFLEDVLPLP